MTVSGSVHFDRRGRGGRKELITGPAISLPTGRVPRVARLMALAVRFEQMLRDGVVRDQAELARLGHVTRARMCQIMSLLHLAPDIQEAVLHLKPVECGRNALVLRDLLPIAIIPDWGRQKTLWSQLLNNECRANPA